jgi:1,4-alpha-glucan branching enzyme
MRMGAAVLLTAPGIPMIWMGQEFGESAPKQVNERQTIDWALLQNDRNTNLLRYYQGLTKLHKENPALLGETFEIVYRDHERCLLGYKRWNDEGNIVIVVVNFKDEYAGGFEISNWPNGNWHEWVYNYDIEVGDGVMRDELAESGVKIYVKMG